MRTIDQLLQWTREQPDSPADLAYQEILEYDRQFPWQDLDTDTDDDDVSPEPQGVGSTLSAKADGQSCPKK